MLRKQKRQLRYAADQLISNPRRNSTDDAHLDLVHLKRRNYPQADSASTKAKQRKRSEPPASDAEADANDSVTGDRSRVQGKDTQAPLPHPDEASIEFDELDELLLADADEELDAAIRQRLRATNRNRRPASDKTASETAQMFADLRQLQVDARARRSQGDSDDVVDLNERAKSDRAKIRQEAEKERHEAELARQQRDQLKQQIESDRLEILKAQQEQAEILQRAEKERAELQEAIKSVRDKAREAEAERAEIIQAIETDRLELSRKLDDERELARKAVQEREDLRKITEQQQHAVRDALALQQAEAKRLADEAQKLEDEARRLESERLAIQQKANRERQEVEKLLEKEREQVRQVGEQWLQIQERASTEHEKIRSLVDSQSFDTAAPPPPPAPLRPSEQLEQSRPSSQSTSLPNQRHAHESHDGEDLASIDKRDRELREQMLREQATETTARQTTESSRDRATRAVSTDAIEQPATPHQEARTNQAFVQRNELQAQKSEADAPDEVPAPMSPPTPNRFSDSSGARPAASIRRKSATANNALPDADTGTLRSEQKTEAQQPLKTEQPEKIEKTAKSDSPAQGNRIPVLESRSQSSLVVRSRSRRLPSFGGIKSMALTMAVFAVVLVGSSLAFFGFLNLGAAQYTADATVAETESGGSNRVAQIFANFRDRIFAGDDKSAQPQGDGDSVALVNSDAGVQSDLNANSGSVAANAPAAEELVGKAEAPEPVGVPAGSAPSAPDVLRGRIVSESDAPVAGVSVTALARKYFTDPKGSSGGVNYRTRTDQSGNFTLRLPPGEEYRVVTDGTHQFAPASVNVFPGKDVTNIVLSDLNGALSVTGRIFTDSLDPIADARAMTQFEPVQEVFSDVDGVYSIQVSPPAGGSDDTLVLRFEAAGYQDGIMHLPANVWKTGKAISHDVFLDPL